MRGVSERTTSLTCRYETFHCMLWLSVGPRTTGSTGMSGKHVCPMCRLKEKGRIFREAFLAKLGLLLRGTVAAPPERYGETLADEHIRGGQFLEALLMHLPHVSMHWNGGVHGQVQQENAWIPP